LIVVIDLRPGRRKRSPGWTDLQVLNAINDGIGARPVRNPMNTGDAALLQSVCNRNAPAKPGLHTIEAERKP
jgi:hypothetical protein